MSLAYMADDPFPLAQEEVRQSVAALRDLVQQWKTQSNSRQSRNFLEKEIRQSLQSLDLDLNDLQEVIDIAQENSSRFNIAPSELKARKNFVQKVRSEIETVKQDLHVGANRQSDRYSKLQEAIEHDNEQFIQSSVQRQEQVIRQQDADLEKLEYSVGTLREIGTEMSTELTSQEQLLTEYDEDISRTHSMMKRATRKINELIDKSSNTATWSIIVVLILIVIGLLVLVVKA